MRSQPNVRVLHQHPVAVFEIWAFFAFVHMKTAAAKQKMLGEKKKKKAAQ